ncbi:hypothetical protein ACPPVV_10550 [Rhodanobacter sp. Col0626]|uniref:hypothetical protein n=1 Tax=Rhodanobacter sp. Col0626 TaxID=3415679 RepID=UPI003CF75F38
MDQDDIKALAVKLAAFTDLLEQRGNEVVRQTGQAALAIDQSARNAAARSEQLTAQAVNEFKRAAADVVAQGLRQPLEEAGRVMQIGTHNIQSATAELEQRMAAIQKVHAANAWKTFIASAIASVAVIGAAAYIGVRTHQDMTRSEWVGQINTAIAKGKLATCAGGGLCAHVGKQWVRLDE